MKIKQEKFSKTKGWEVIRDDYSNPQSYNFVLVFGGSEILSDPLIFTFIKTRYPNADILLNSTAGEIIDTQVNDETISLTAINFEKTKIKTTAINIEHVKNSYVAGKNLASMLDPDDLKNVLLISDGQKVNGSDLVKGMQEYLPEGTIITGG
jgi:hypothetical protein